MIGITGGIASGKSVVSKRLRHLGAVVIDADLLAKEVVEPLTPGWEKVREAFPQVIRADLTIDRRLLGQIVFSDIQQRRLLESMIHPEVLRVLLKEAKQAEKAGKNVFAEVPLLYEVGWERFMREVWVVYVRPDIQLQRLMERAGISKEEALQRMASQISLEEKVQRAEKVIDNNGSLEETFRQVDALWEELGWSLRVDQGE